MEDNITTIWDAIRNASSRNQERDARLAERRIRFGTPQFVAPTPVPVVQSSGGDGGDGGGPVDTRTPHEKYLDAIDVNNSFVTGLPGVGTVIGALNDSYIEDYEAKNPDKVVGGGINKYSMVGRAMGRGLTAEEQLQAKKDGLGIGNALFGETNELGVRPASYSLLDRIAGNVPLNWVTQGDYIGSFPEGTTPTSSGWETSGGDSGGDGGGYDGPEAGRGTYNFGGRESSVSYSDYSGYA